MLPGMSLDDLVSVTITLESASVEQESFGIPLIAAYHTHNTNRVRTYDAATALTDMVADSFSTTEPAYLAAAALLSAQVRVKQIKIGRRDGAWQQITRITPAAAINSTVYSVTVNGTVASYTSDSSATLAEICTGLATAIDALPLVTATGASGTFIDVTTTAAGTLASFTGAHAPSTLKIEDVSTDATIAADLAAIALADDDWYAFTIDSNADAEIVAAAAWAETQKKIFGATLRGTRALDSTDTTDTATTLKNAAYQRTFEVYHSDSKTREAERLIGERLPSDPSFGASWAFAQLSGVTVEALTASQLNSLRGKNVNTYERRAGLNVILFGSMAKSRTLFIDQVTLIDELTARIQERVFAKIVLGLPYSNESADRICAEILAELTTHVDRGSLLADPKPTASHPDVATVSPTDRANRLLPDVVFSAQTAGRIHTVTIRGKLSV